MLESVLLMGGLGLVIGGVLAFASKIFYVYVDPKVAAIDEVLPGANCGGCGFPGCTSNAEAIVAGKSPVDSCVAAGSDVAAAIAEIMGVSLGEKEPEFALPGCRYGVDEADVKYLYDGIDDCRAAALVSGGMKVCDIGCLGFGTCVAACPFDALEMGDKGLPVVDQEKCTGCGTCERVCPKHIIRLTSVTRRIMREYTEDQCITSCQRACPTGIDIREYISLIKDGRYEQAVQVIKERNPFPTVIGRICPAPCEFQCRRQLVDSPVAINDLKRFVCDIEMKQGSRLMPYSAPQTGRQIAVIGGGVEGLSAAFFSARLGHSPTVFESTTLLGGLLRVAISEDRLPREVLDWDIQGILEMGVDAKMSSRAGRDYTIPGLLRNGFDAVFTASGGWDDRVARGDIEDAVSLFPGGYLLIDLLRINTAQNPGISCGDHVVIAGGGGVVYDAVKLCRQLGAENILVMSRQTPEHAAFDGSRVEAVADGVSVIYNCGITRLFGEEECLTHLEYICLDSGEKRVIPADTLFISSGRFPELVFLRLEQEHLDTEQENQNTQEKNQNTEQENQTSEGESEKESIEKQSIIDQSGLDEICEKADLPLKWEGIEVYKKPMSRMEIGLLSREDPTSGYSAAVKAINGGRKAAASIHNLMYNIPLGPDTRPITSQSIIQDVVSLEGVDVFPRQIMPVSTECSGRDQGIPLGFTEEMAKNEAGRCLQCGLLCYARTEKSEEMDKTPELSEPAE
ncbi:MAG: RnfABCDGE type electron transport complex subunit B [Thermodesulfobacteriota bacterium]|nr:RnfABCDGE type electron transport complex subunit B [Thermodesulfobacteriota bacterium]